MSDNLRIKFEATFSELADFTDPEWTTNWDSDDSKPNEAQQFTRIVGTSSEDLDLMGLSTPTRLVIQNTDPQNYVTLSIGRADDTTLRAHRIEPGAIFATSDIDTTNTPTLQANGSPVRIKGLIAGS